MTVAGKIAIDCYAAPAAGKPLEPWTYEVDALPSDGEVDLEITHCGLCHSDVHQVDNSWGIAKFPLVPGHEIVGKVVSVGGGVEGFKVGDLAAIGVQRGSCDSCACCKDGLENLCPKILKTYGGPGNDRGGFAKVIRYPQRWLFRCPDGVPAEHVGPLMCAGVTVFSPLKRFLMQGPGGPVGKRVGVIGIGGLGHLGVQFAAKMGAVVVAISRTESKAEEARSFGAESLLASSNEEAMRAAAGTFDVLLNTVSGAADLDAYLRLLKPRGTMACVGLPEVTEKCKMLLQSVVPQERNMCGSYLGPYADYAEMLEFARKHEVKPVVELYPLSEVNVAMERVRDNKARYRCVLVME